MNEHLIKNDSSDNSLFLERADPALEHYLDSRYLRVAPGVLRWRVTLAGFLAKAASLARSLSSGIASADVVATRRASCFAPCDRLVRVGDRSYCGACGCGRTALAELGTKLRFATATCPLKRPGFSNSAAAD